MKVGFFAPSAYLISGLATFLNSLLPELRSAGWDARLMLVSGPKFHKVDRYLEVHPDQAVTIVHAPTATPEGRRRAIRAALSANPMDLALSINIPDLVATVADMRHRGEPTPRVATTVHGLDQNIFMDVNRFAAGLDGVICTNRLSCLLAEKLGELHPDRIHYAGYGVSIPNPIHRTAASKSLRLLYVGRLDEEQKRILDVVAIARAASMHAPVRLTIAGDGPARPRFLDALAKAASSQLEVCDLGRVEAGRLPDLYADHDALLVTSLWETGPQVALEAMANRLPVVSSRFIGSGLEGALEHEMNAMLFEIGDTGAAAEHCLALWRNPGLRRELVANAEGLVEVRYSTAAFASAWDSALRGTIAAPPAAGLAYSPAQSGSLDRLLGIRIGESVRQLVGREPVVVDGGSEWPSAYSTAPSNAAFWQLAQAFDRTGATS